LLAGSLSVTTRGCAQQDYAYQTFKRGKGWSTERRIEEGVYSEGCHHAVGSNDIRRHVTTYCYCSSDLCNSEEPLRPPAERRGRGEEPFKASAAINLPFVTVMLALVLLFSLPSRH